MWELERLAWPIGRQLAGNIYRRTCWSVDRPFEMETEVTSKESGSAWLLLAVEALKDAGELFGFPSMSESQTCEQPREYEGAYVWLTGNDMTLLMGVQCESLEALGRSQGEEEPGPILEAGTDVLSELLNIVAGVAKNKAEEGDDALELGMPVMAPGSIAPRVTLSNAAIRVAFGEIVLVVSLIEMNLSPEARRRKQEEEKNARLMQELQLAQKLEAVGQLAAGVAHEINTPLQYLNDTFEFLSEAFGDISVLLTSLEGVEAKLDACEEAKPLVAEMRDLKSEADTEFLLETVPESIGIVRKGMSRISIVVKALKDVGNAGLLDRQAVDLNELIANTLVITDNRYEAVADVVQDWGELPMIEADPGQLSQVFIQLLINAAEAIGVATQQSAEPDRGEIRVSTRQEGEFVVVDLSDTGCGVAEEIRGRIFDPFFTTKGVDHNMGQGLSTVRTIIVEGHTGEIDVESEVGRGTKFTLRLPIGSAGSAGEAAA